MKAKTKKIISVLLVLALLCIGVFIGQLLMIRRPEVAPEVVPAETATPTETPTPTEKPTPTPTPEPTVPQKIDFPNLWETNVDCFAYLEIPDTIISYPILQSSIQEEDYYLTTTFEGAHGYPGSIYAQMANMQDFSDNMTVLFGHNMKDGSYFGTLRQYADPTFYENHRTIMVYHPGYQFRYKVCATTVMPEDYLTTFDVRSKRTPIDCIKGIIESKETEETCIISDDIQIEYGDQILVLYTCIGGRPKDRRLVVAKLIERIKTDPQYVQPVRTPTPTAKPS